MSAKNGINTLRLDTEEDLPSNRVFKNKMLYEMFSDVTSGVPSPCFSSKPKYF